MHGGVEPDKIKEPNEAGLVAGLPNLGKHIRNLKSFGQNIVVAFNKYSYDAEDEIETVRNYCKRLKVGFAVNNAYMQGGAGAEELAALVADTIDKEPSLPLQFTYRDGDSIEDKIDKVAKGIYGARQVIFSTRALKMLSLVDKMGISHYPVCIAKTQYSFSGDPKAYGVVDGFDLDIKDIIINNGSEMIVAVAGDMMRMPGLPKEPQATKIDITDGIIEGLS